VIRPRVGTCRRPDAGRPAAVSHRRRASLFIVAPVETTVTVNERARSADAGDPEDEAPGLPDVVETGDRDRGYRSVRQMEAEEGPMRYRLPDPTLREMFAIADQLLGASKLIVMCEDGKSRMARIPGKMKRRMWIKPGDLVIVKPWDFQDDKADVRYRYIKVQAANLSKRGLIPELLDGGFK
jgi:translation initiation factor 1A